MFGSGDKGTGFNLSLDEWLMCLALETKVLGSISAWMSG